MELKAEYRRETYRNYVLLDNGEDNITEAGREELYEIPMLLNNKIPYLLNVQITYLNERARYGYDITSNQAIFDWIERRKIKSDDCEHLYSSVFGAIDACCEYLLDESNLVLLPEYIYYDMGKNLYRFIYYVHYHSDIIQQINELSEFLMDHIDYEDERTVLLVYAMYHESKRKEASIDTLITVFKEKKKLKEDKILGKSQKLNGNPELNVDQRLAECQKLVENQKLAENQNENQKLDTIPKLEEGRKSEACEIVDSHKWNKENKTEAKQVDRQCDYVNTEKANVVLKRKQLIKRPIMESRQESERLVSKYPSLSYSVVGVTLFVMLIVILYSISQGLEPKKLIAVILIVASITAYIGSKMFDPKKKVEKLIPVVEYIKQPAANAINQLAANDINQPDNRINMDNNKEFYIKEETRVKEEIVDSNDIIYGNANLYYNNCSDSEDFMNGEDDLSECTQLLSVVEECGDTDNASESDNHPNIIDLKTQYVLLPENDKYNKLKISEFPFYLGKITDGMDAVIMESTISRVHAKITMEDEYLYITDMGSTNGTYINEENIQPHMRVQIKIGDLLRFANVSYTFSDI